MNTMMWKKSQSTWQAWDLRSDAAFEKMIDAGAETEEVILRRNGKGIYGIQAQICTVKRDNGIPED